VIKHNFVKLFSPLMKGQCSCPPFFKRRKEKRPDCCFLEGFIIMHLKFFLGVWTSSRTISDLLVLQVVLPEGSKNPQPVVPFQVEKHLEVIHLSIPTLIMSPSHISQLLDFWLLNHRHTHIISEEL
jgi:hypothetical protein